MGEQLENLDLENGSDESDVEAAEREWIARE